MSGLVRVKGEAVALARLAIPVALTQLATMLMGLVDTLMVGRLGTEALGACALGSLWVFGTLVVGMGVLHGLDPIVTQAHGAADPFRAGLALQRGLVLSVLLSVPLAVAWAFTGPALVALGQDPGLAEMAHRYALVQAPSLPFFLGFTALRQFLAGRGITMPPLVVAWVANVVNVFLNWMLVFGHLGSEPLGIVGSGIATTLSRIFMALALAFLAVRGGHLRGAWPRWSRDAWTPRGLREVLGHGVPLGAQFAFEVWAFNIAGLIAGTLGAAELAAHSIVLNMASFTFMVPLGISIAAATRVGNLIGAGDLPGARLASRVALGLGAGVMSVSALAFLLLRWQLPRLWDPEPEVLALAASILPIAAAFQVFDGTQVVGGGVLRGRGDTRPGAAYNLVGYYALGLPLAWLLAVRLGRGLPGIWWGLTLALLAVAALLCRRVLRAR